MSSFNYDPRVLAEFDVLLKLIIERAPEEVANMKKFYIEKNTGYAGKHKDPHHNLKLGEPVRVSATQYCYSRMNDKMGRLSNVISDALDAKSVLKDGKDGIIEEFGDMGLYGIIGIIMRKEWKNIEED